MSINLSKGQKINLSKGSNGPRWVMVGLGWDEVEQNKGILRFFLDKPEDIDCDAFAIMLGKDGKVIKHTDTLSECCVYYNHLRWTDDAIIHKGDNTSGVGEGDDEQIVVDLLKVSHEIAGIVFAVNIYKAFERKQHFGLLKNAYIRVVDCDKNVELCRYDLNENYFDKTALIAGKMIRENGGWEFVADGAASRVEEIKDVVKSFY